MDKYDLISIGDITIDAFLALHNSDKVSLNTNTNTLCVKYGEKIDVDSCIYALGGNAANVTIGTTRLGVKSALFAEIGDDEFSLKILNGLAKEGVSRAHIRQSRNQQSSMSIALNFKGERTLFVEHVKRKHDFEFNNVTADYIYLTSLGEQWKNAYAATLQFANEHKIKLLFNPGTIQLREDKEMLSKVLEKTEILFVNKEEAEEILYNRENEANNDQDYFKKLLTSLQLLGPKLVVITDGHKGSYLQDGKGRFYYQQSPKTHVIEPTGAGDSYASGFLAAYIGGKDLQTAMLWGTFNAASVISQIGAQQGLLTKAQMDSKVDNYA